MGDLAAVLLGRVEQARRHLRQARADGDAYSVDVFAAELADLERRAAAHGITLREPGDGTADSDRPG